MIIVTTLDEPGVEEYGRLIESIRKQSNGVQNLRTVVLYGEVSSK